MTTPPCTYTHTQDTYVYKYTRTSQAIAHTENSRGKRMWSERVAWEVLGAKGRKRTSRERLLAPWRAQKNCEASVGFTLCVLSLQKKIKTWLPRPDRYIYPLPGYALHTHMSFIRLYMRISMFSSLVVRCGHIMLCIHVYMYICSCVVHLQRLLQLTWKTRACPGPSRGWHTCWVWVKYE